MQVGPGTKVWFCSSSFIEKPQVAIIESVDLKAARSELSLNFWDSDVFSPDNDITT